MARLVPVKGTPIVVCDEGGPRAAVAAATLEGMGHADVSALEGGLNAWARAGLPLDRGMGGYVGQPDDVTPITYGDRARMEYYLAWEEALGRKYEGAE